MDEGGVARRLAAGGPHSGRPDRPGRRRFLQLTALAGGGLLIAWAAPKAWRWGERRWALQNQHWLPSEFITIHPDNTVEIQVNRLDSGQGALTALPMLLAEELDIDWEQVRASLAPAGLAYRDPFLGIQMTGGSSGVPNSWIQYREIGAAARSMLVQAAAARWQVPASSCTTGSGIVRSGSQSATYAALSAEAARVPVPRHVALKSPAEFRIIGRSQTRIDGVTAASGAKIYGIDVRLPDMVVALLLRAPRFGGQVERFDAAGAFQVPGVIDVFPVPTDRGGTGIAIIAGGYWPAKQARDRIEVSWKPGVGGNVSSAALLESYRAAARAPVSTVLDADVRPGQDAAVHLAGDYVFPYLAHAPMEPLNATFEPTPAGVTVWYGAQFQTTDQVAIADTLHLKPEQVRLMTLPAGGSFGRRATPTADYLREGADILRVFGERLGRRPPPVKVMWSREDDIKGGYYRPVHLHRVDVALDARGQVLVWDHVVIGQSLSRGTPFEARIIRNGVDSTMVEGLAENVYGLPMRLRVTHPEVDVPVLWWRSVGHTHTAYVVETLVDEIAHHGGVDPVAWRLARWPLETHPRQRAALQLAVEKSGYGQLPQPGHALGVAVHESFDTVVAYVVDVSLVEGRARVHRVTAGVHANQIVNPSAAIAQIEGGILFGLAMTRPGFEITLKDGIVQQSQFTDYPPPRITDAPAIAVHFVSSSAPPSGLGEPGVPPIAPAIANALFALTGKRLRRLPFDLSSS